MKTSTKRPVIKTRPFKKNRFSWWTILAYIILPFYKLWLGLVWIYEFLFCEKKWTKWNGVFGPGGDTHSYHEFSLPKLCLILIIIIILYLIFYF